MYWIHSSRQFPWTHHRTQLSSSERRGAAPEPRAGAPLQPEEDPGAAGAALQPLETQCCSRWMSSEGSCSLWRAETWQKLWPLERTPHRSRFSGSMVCGSPTLQQSIPEGPHPLKRTHSGAILQELQPVGRSHIGAVHKEQMPWQGPHSGAREKYECYCL